jgi:hypothetical protein
MQGVPIRYAGSVVMPPEKAAPPVRWPADKVVRRDLASLIPSARNARTHGPAQVAQIARTIERFGWTNPVLVDEGGEIIAGHGRVMAAKELGLDQVPVMVAAGWTSEQKRLYALADNRIALSAEWDDAILAAELRSLSEIADLSLAGFGADEIDKILAKTEGPDKLDDVSDELPGAAALKDWINFDSTLPWNIPPIRADLLAPWPDKEVKAWASDEDVFPDDGESWYVWNFRLGSVRGLPADRKILGFYTDDTRFECMWDETPKWVAKILNVGFRVAISPNYSMYMGEPRAVHLWATYRARWVGRYMQEAGIALIPDVNWADAASFEYCLLGIPENAPAISVQLQTLNTPDEIARAVSGVQMVARKLRPQTLAVYCGPTGHKVIQAASLPADVRVVLVESRTSVRRKVIKEKYHGRSDLR